VQALFAADAERVERLYFDARTAPLLGGACALLAARRRPYRLVEGAELEKILGSPLHGGVVAVAPARPVRPLDLEAARLWAREGAPLLLMDGVSNPNNLGAIVRTAAFFGLTRIVLSDHPGQALPSESAYRVAEGGFEHVDLYRAAPFAPAVARLGSWYRTLATALGDHRPLTHLHGRTGNGTAAPPVAVVLGNEEHGLPPETLRACREVATIPGSGAVQSLNVAATAAILIHAMTRGE
jgi:TrmH RNA methyltransferase